jgi:hypothetical protein
MRTAKDWRFGAELARMSVGEDLARHIPEIRLTPTRYAGVALSRMWLGPTRLASWDWARVTKRPSGTRFDLAIWHDTRLCGLAAGPAGEAWIGMEYLEACPSPHPLRGMITGIALAVLETQAAALNLSEARLLGAEPVLVKGYEARGYITVAKPSGLVYLSKKIGKGKP